MLYEDCEWIMQCGMLFDNNEAHCPFDVWHHTCVQYLLMHRRFYFLSLVPDNSLPIPCWLAMIHRKALDKQTSIQSTRGIMQVAIYTALIIVCLHLFVLVAILIIEFHNKVNKRIGDMAGI